MREIKFRAYIKKSKQLVQVKSIHLGTKKIMVGYSKSKNNYGNYTISFNEIELMQYTGLKDKNGEEIYEGDILKSYYYIDTPNGEQERYHQKEIKFDEISCEYNINAFENLEVIGNIYDNPELLKEE